jgi:hypothetical protein
MTQQELFLTHNKLGDNKFELNRKDMNRDTPQVKA